MILRADGEVVPLASTGTPLGLLPPGLPYGETTEALRPGDTLVLFSDGVTDAQNAADEEFGEARLLDVLRASAGSPVDDDHRPRVRRRSTPSPAARRSSTTSRCWSCGACRR